MEDDVQEDERGSAEEENQREQAWRKKINERWPAASLAAQPVTVLPEASTLPIILAPERSDGRCERERCW